jgi:ligand-binding sensor domain-containing protein/AraC-like DNA-binding protein
MSKGFLDSAGRVVYIDREMPKGKSSPARPRRLHGAATVLSLLLALSPRLFPARSAALKAEYDRWVRRSWTTRDGLPQDTVYALAQAADGCLWIGSEGGAARFDGAAFTAFRRGTTPGLASDSVTALAAGPDGSVWAGTFGGGLCQQRRGRFARVAGLAAERIWSLHREESGALWIVSAEGEVSCLESGRQPAQALIDGLPGGRATAIAGSEQDVLWIGTHGGLAAIRSGRQAILRRSDGLAGDDVYCLFVDRGGSLWVGTTTGLSRVDAAGIRRFTSADGLAGDLVRAISEDALGRIWIGTDQGVTVMDPGSVPACAVPDGLDRGAVMAICRDREGGMWVGFAAEGLGYWRRNEARVHGSQEGLPGDQVTAVCLDGRGRLWAGTRGRGLARRENGAWRSFSGRDGLAGGFVTSLLAEGADRLWVGTREAGLQLMEDGAFIRGDPRASAAGTEVLSLFRDSRGRLWAGTDGAGLDCLQDGSWRHVGPASGLRGDVITSLAEDRQGRLWAGSVGEGVHVLDRGVWRRYSPADGLAGDTVYAVHADGRGNVWLGTDNGLALFRRERFFSFRRAGAALNGSILAILEDGAGGLWMSTLTGVLSARAAELEEAAAHEGPGVGCRLFGEMSGLRSTVCAGGFQPAACRDGLGRLWFPTQNGLVEIDANGLGAPPPPPVPFIAGLRADGITLSLEEGARLPAGFRRLDFRFSAASFADPQQVEFATRLDGLETGWSAPTRQGERGVPTLPPGEYAFRVRARGAGGGWSRDDALHRFAIVGSFPARGGLALFLLAAGATAAGLLLQRRLRIRRRQEGRYRGSPLDGERAADYAARLDKAMESGRAFLDPELTLGRLAAATEIPAKQLSQLINERYGLNFNDFINRRRIDEAKRLLLDPACSGYKLLRIAFESGFNSKSVFNASFRRHAGASPSEFRRLLGGNDGGAAG